MKKCPKCGKEHDKSGIFCSRTCANSRGPRTDEFKKAVSIKLKGNIPWNKGNDLKINKTCEYCGSLFLDHPNAKQKFCSKQCAVLGQDRSNQGGYREGSGRSKSGYYKGIYCGSTYELVWVIYRLDHNLTVKRFDGSIEGNGIKYFPDFIDGNTIIELKGFWNTLVDKKSELARQQGYDVEILYKNDLKNEFEWVKQNYQYVVLHELYDNSKSKLLTYICSECGKEFISNRKRKSEKKYCSRECAGVAANKQRYSMAC